MKKECLFGHSFALLEQWEAVIFSLLLYYIQLYTIIGVQLFKFHVGYGKGTDLPCTAEGGILEIEMLLFLSKERNRV